MTALHMGIPASFPARIDKTLLAAGESRAAEVVAYGEEVSWTNVAFRKPNGVTEWSRC